MKMYVRSAACLSPAFPMLIGGDEVRAGLKKNSGQSEAGRHLNAAGKLRLNTIEPGYDQYIDSKMIRRMSRIVKMGVTAALQCLRNARNPEPGALITGTAYGCLEDTGIFLRKMISNNEELLSPTAFIQSTHNTVGAQIALLLKCHAYNNSIVHRAFSLEHTLTEAEMLLAEEMGPVLVGAIDETTDDSFTLLRRFGQGAGGPELPTGEGAAFFLLAARSSGQDLARIDHVATRLAPEMNGPATLTWIRDELRGAGYETKDIEFIFDGSNGMLPGAQPETFPDAGYVDFKKLCGEFPTASGFALWLAAIYCADPEPRILKKPVLIFNRTEDGHHSLILVSPC